MNLRKLGKRQKKIIALLEQGNIICSVHDERDSTNTICVTDEQRNDDLMMLKEAEVNSLLKRGIITGSTFRPCLEILILEFRLINNPSLFLDCGSGEEVKIN